MFVTVPLKKHCFLLKLFLFLGFSGRIALSQDAVNRVNGTLVQFNDNGAWCWFQDERSVVDTTNGRIIIGSVACGSGTGGESRNGAVEAVIFDLAGRTPERYVLTQWANDCDDHNTPGFLVRPDGKYLAMYSRHYDKFASHYRIFHDSLWNAEKQFDWTTIPGGTDYTIAYSNLYYLSNENRIYNFARANHRSPNLIYSDDLGENWQYGGQLTTNASHSYNKGYYKFWSNGVDRIDFLLTEQHPRDTSTSIYHGFIKNGRSYASEGDLADSNIFDTLHIPSFRNFTPVFRDNTQVEGNSMRRCWIADLVSYPDHTISAIITTRINDNQGGGSSEINPDHALIYCRYDGSHWSCHYLCKAGLKMYPSEQDYTGLGALCPDDPNTLYLSTPYNPATDSLQSAVHEIFKGVTTDGGNSWNWYPVTINSEYDNFRPIVPHWNKKNLALLWWRGTYNSAQNYDASVVGIIESLQEKTGLLNEVTVTKKNTSLWGKEGQITNERTASLLKTHITVPLPGIYDVWVNIRKDTGVEGRLKAGLSPEKLQIFRHMSSRRKGIYTAYLGRIKAIESDSFDVYVDEENHLSGKFRDKTGQMAISFAKIEFTQVIPGSR